jgi:hypothetical protein
VARELTRWTRPWLAATAVPALWLAAAGRPFHVDDPLFLAWARAIAPLPGEFTPARLDWDLEPETLADATRHYPPGWALLLAGARRILEGDSAEWMRWLSWPFAATGLAGCARLAAAFGAPPRTVFWLCATSPLFLVPLPSIMPDIACLGPGVLGLALWLSARATRERAVAAVLVALSAQMKQTVLPLLPLLFWPPPPGRRPDDPPAARLGIAAAACVLAGLFPPVPPHDRPGSLADQLAWILPWAWSAPLLLPKLAYALHTASALAVFPAGIAAAFLGGRPGAAPLERRHGLALGAGAVFLLALAGAWKVTRFPTGSIPDADGDATTLWFHGALAVFIGWGYRILSAAPPGPPRGPLLAWLGLVLAGALVGSPFPAARFSVFLLPPLAVLFALDLRRLDPRVRRAALAAALLGNAWLSVSLAWNDAAFARFAVQAARRGAAEAESAGVPLRTTGQWGLRRAVEEAGGRLAGRDELLPQGALLLHPEVTDHRPLPAAAWTRRSGSEEAWTLSRSGVAGVLFPAAPLAPAVRAASFHGGHVWFPYTLTADRLERIRVRRVAPAQRLRPSSDGTAVRPALIPPPPGRG